MAIVSNTDYYRLMVQQACIWMLTIPNHSFMPYLPPNVNYMKGQLECGIGGFIHWQLVVHFKRSVRLNCVRETFGDFHAEVTRSEAAETYVWKDDTYIDGTRFELGNKPFKRNSKRDWEQIWDSCKRGRTDQLDPSLLFYHYRTVKSIITDYSRPMPVVRECKVFWGRSGLGKSRTAWAEAGLDAYSKNSRTKWWDSYQAQDCVIIDEFRGAIDVAYLLQWLDRYPVSVETKHGNVAMNSSKFWICSNLHPKDWYPLLDGPTYEALLRRIKIVHFDSL